MFYLAAFHEWLSLLSCSFPHCKEAVHNQEKSEGNEKDRDQCDTPAHLGRNMLAVHQDDCTEHERGNNKD